jgi:hypothetical protein
MGRGQWWPEASAMFLTVMLWDDICPFRGGPSVGPMRPFERKLRVIDLWSYADLLGPLDLCRGQPGADHFGRKGCCNVKTPEA